MRDSKYMVQRQTECLRKKPRECACVSLRKRMWDRESVREKEKERERERCGGIKEVLRRKRKTVSSY